MTSQSDFYIDFKYVHKTSPIKYKHTPIQVTELLSFFFHLVFITDAMGYDSLDDLPLPPPPDVEEEELDNIEYLQMLLDYGSSLSRPASPKRKRNKNDWERTKQSKAYNYGKIKKVKGRGN